MIVEKVLVAMARMQFEKLSGSPSKIGTREKLGDSVDLLSHQERMLGALSLSRSRGQSFLRQAGDPQPTCSRKCGPRFGNNQIFVVLLMPITCRRLGFQMSLRLFRFLSKQFARIS
jgi:hypothetical protein